jgi:L-ascorbate metabolism protein UlaG (beta-lactamase superfamily)
MKIQWLGHACFLITSAEGVRVLTDPFDESVGYPLPQVEADIVTISHHHFDHNHTAPVQGSYEVFDQPGRYTSRGVEILGVATFHDKEQGQKRGKNTMFKLTIDGIHLLHCGDLGHDLSAEQAAEISPVDVVLVPVGGTYTIDGQEARRLVEQLQPSVTIPMHFKTPVMDFPITSVDPFLSEAGGGRRQGSTEIELTRESLRQNAGVIVLDYPQKQSPSRSNSG